MSIFSRLIAGFVVFYFGLQYAGADADKKAPDKMAFTAKPGNVTFDHAAHSERAKNDCKICHEKLFPESSKAPLNYKAAVHKTAETAKTSCGACHVPAGVAFQSKGNCSKCHVK